MLEGYGQELWTAADANRSRGDLDAVLEADA